MLTLRTDTMHPDHKSRKSGIKLSAMPILGIAFLIVLALNYTHLAYMLGVGGWHDGLE